MTLLRLLIVAIAVALGTVILAWWIVPITGAAYGVLARDTGRPGLIAGLGAAAGWGGYLSIVSMGGAPIFRFAGDLAHAMQLPAWAPYVATLAFAALLAGPGAVVAAELTRRPNTKRSRRD